MADAVDKSEDMFMLDQSGRVWKISDGYRLREGLAREVVEVPKNGQLEIEFENIGVVRW